MTAAGVCAGAVEAGGFGGVADANVELAVGGFKTDWLGLAI